MVICFPASDCRLHTNIGKRSGGFIELTDTGTGCGLFGPYIELAPGGYAARIRLAADGERCGRVEMNISAQSGAIVIAREFFELGELPKGAASIAVAFVLPDILADCEVRVFCEAGVRATVSALEIEPNIEKLAPEMAPELRSP